MERVYLGVGREKITPKIGAQLFGYRPDVFAEAVEDDLTATAFYFRQGDTKALMISITVCLLNTELCDSIREMLSRETGVSPRNIMLCATHTHSGPNTIGSIGWGDIDKEYCEEIFCPAILSAARSACASPVPVKMGVGYGKSDIGINRREFDRKNQIRLGQNPWGCYNPEMIVISFKGDDGKILANMVHYGCHGTAAGLSTLISRDWAGVMTDTLERETGAVTAFFNGPEGDVGPRLSNGETVGLGDIRYVYELGHAAALDAVRIFRSIAGYCEEIPLQAGSATVKIPLQKRISREKAQAIYERFKKETINLAGRMRAYALDVLDSYEKGYVDEETFDFQQAMVRLGNIVFTSSIFESFSEIGMRIDSLCPDMKVLSLSNTNGSKSYFATEDQLCLGGYEVSMHLYGGIQPYCAHADWEMIRQCAENVMAMTEGK